MPALFFLELFLLFILSRKTTQSISYLLYVITRSRRIAIFGIAFIFLPGTIIHEFSHATAAFLTHVPVGKMELFPEIHEGALKLGSVQVGKTDIVRNFFIGVAPFLFGTVLLFLIIYLMLSPSFPFVWWVVMPLFYLIFAISNTMFSSRRDMEGAIEFGILVTVLFFVSYLLGFHPQDINWGGISQNVPIFRQAVIFVGIPIGIDLGIILLVFAITKRL